MCLVLILICFIRPESSCLMHVTILPQYSFLILFIPLPLPSSPQARVYYEEALSVQVDSFSDTPLLVALFTNLTAVYLKQRMTDKLPQTLEKAGALLLCLPCHAFTSTDEVELLNLLLRRSVVMGDKHLEARVCYLTSSLFLQLKKTDDALPFVERLQFLSATLSATDGHPIAPVDLNWLLSWLYHRKYMPYLALASLSLDTRQDHSLSDAFQRIGLFIKNSVRLNPRWKEGTSLLPAQIVVYLQQALAVAERGEDIKTQRDLCQGLASVYQQYNALDNAVRCAQQAVETGGHINEEEGFEASVLLGWLLVLTGQAERAQSILQPLLTSLQVRQTLQIPQIEALQLVKTLSYMSSTIWISCTPFSGHRQSHAARSDPQPLGFVSEAAGSHPRGRLAPPFRPGDLQGKWKPEEPGPGTGQPGLPGTGCGSVSDGGALPGQVR